MSRYKHQILLSSFCLAIMMPCAVPASEPESNEPLTNSATTALHNPSNLIAQASPLSGSVKAVDIEAGECLRQMGDALKKMERAGLELMGEATRQDYISVGDPNVVGTIILPALPDNMMATGPYLQMRPKWVDYYLDQIGKMIPIYAELTDSLVMPDAVKAQSTALLDQMRPLFVDAKERYLALVAVGDYKKADNMKVAKLAVELHDDMEKMEKIRLQVFKLLKTSEKGSN